MPPRIVSKSGIEKLAPELTLSETLRVLEVARGMRRDRTAAEVAMARSEVREVMRKRLLDAAAITGDSIIESDIDAAIDQYFSTQNTYCDPPMSFPVFLAQLYVRRLRIGMIAGTLAFAYLVYQFVL